MLFRKFVQISSIGLIAAVAASYGGNLHPLGDSLAVFRVQICVLLVISLILTQNRWLGLAGVLLIISTAISQINHRYPAKPTSPTTFTVYQKNMLFRIKDTKPLAADIVSSGTVDFIMLQEVTSRNNGLMNEISGTYKYQHSCPFASVGGTALLSKWPVIEGSPTCFEGGGLTAMQVETPEGALWLMSVHLNWPYPHSQAAQASRLYPQIKALKGRKIIAGDFNMVPWSYVVRRFENVSNTHRVGGVIPSFVFPKIPLGIPIDHVLAPETCTGTSERRPFLGSDHYGILAKISCP